MRDRSIRNLLHVVLMFVSAVGVARTVSADVAPAAAIRIRVVAPPALVHVPVTIQLIPDGDPSRPRSAKTETTRVASFPDLPPGRYHVTVELAGATTASADVRVGVRDVLILQVTFEVAGRGPSRVDVLDRAAVGEGTEFTRRLLDDLPVSRDLGALVDAAAPFVIVDRMDNGGLGLARSPLMGSRGASWTATSAFFGDAEVSHPSPAGTLSIAPDLIAAEAVTVTSGLAPVEIGTPGVSIAIVPRRAANVWGGTFDTSFTPHGLVATNDLPGVPSIARLTLWRDAALVAGGPIGHRAGLVVSGSTTHSTQQDRDRPLELEADRTTLAVDLSNTPSARDRVHATIGLQRLTRPFDGRLQLHDTDVDEAAGFSQAHATWEHAGDNGMWRALSIGYTRGALTPDTTSADGGTIDRVLDGPVPSPASAVVSSQWNVSGRVSPHDIAWRTTHHSVRAGLTISRSTLTSDVLALPPVAEMVDGLPARVWVPNAPLAMSRRALTESAVYVSDSIQVARHLTVDAGMRGDFVSGAADGANEGIAWRTASPRVSFRWSYARFAVFGGYGRYAGRDAMSLLAFGDPGEPSVDVYRWKDDDADGRFEPNEQGELVARAGWGPDVASIDPALQAPRTNELTLGGELHRGRLMTFRGAIITRRQTNLVESVNVGVPLSGYRLFFVPDQYADFDNPADDRPLAIYDRLPASFGQDQFLLTNPTAPPGIEATYAGVELSWEMTTPRWYVMFGATAHRTRGLSGNRGFGPLENDPGVVGELFEQPNAMPVTPGDYFFDRSYVGKWSASYHGPRDVRLAFSARYQDGQPFSRVVIADGLAAGPEMIEAYRAGQTRFTYAFTLDARVEKGFALAGHRAAIRLDAFNLTNHANEVEEDVVSGPTFRDATAVQPPLTLRLGFHMDF